MRILNKDACFILLILQALSEILKAYQKLESNKWYLSVFVDASFNGMPDGQSSAFGYIIFLSGGYAIGKRGKCCVLSWKANKLRRVVTSTFEAETLALAEALDEAFVLRHQILQMMGLPDEMLKIEAFSDCNDCVEAVHSTKQVNGAKRDRARLDLAKIKQMLERGEVDTVSWVPTDYQLADPLTKRGRTKISMIQTLREGKFFS